MQSRAVLSFVVLSSLSLACGRSGSGSASIDVAVEIEAALSDALEVSHEVAPPSDNNAAEVWLDVTNRSAERRDVSVAGKWTDSRGRFRGGRSTELALPAGGSGRVHLPTSSRDAVRLVASVGTAGAAPAPAPAAARRHPVRRLVAGSPASAYSFTRTPSVASIPNAPLRGNAGSEQFVAKTATFIRDARTGEWALEIWSEPLADKWDLGRYDADRRFLKVELPEEPARGVVIDKPFAYGGGLFQVASALRTTGTMSWNSKNAWVLSIDDWDVRRWSDAGDPDLQEVGSATIRFAGCYEASGGVADSCLAGTFRGARVFLAGRP